ncbi:hypothetical protein GCM10022212_04020 [Actimicrobium antarcticum]|uniref:Uncharacterized protein n=1 Tax=Actimicrobium antarcticum TaxID=1051899 RepID=A0ABP7SL70_9BURK
MTLTLINPNTHVQLRSQNIATDVVCEGWQGVSGVRGFFRRGIAKITLTPETDCGVPMIALGAPWLIDADPNYVGRRAPAAVAAISALRNPQAGSE